MRDDPLYKNRKTLLTTQQWLTDKQQTRLDQLWAYDKDYAALKVAWHAYQGIIDCYRMSNKRDAKSKMRMIINELRKLKGPNRELAQLGRSLHKRLADVLAFFAVGVSNGPVEAINGRLEHLRGIELGFRNINHYILRSLIHSGQLTHKINALQIRKSHQNIGFSNAWIQQNRYMSLTSLEHTKAMINANVIDADNTQEVA